jgi:DNA-binding NarL/FixJ family response regulator
LQELTTHIAAAAAEHIVFWVDDSQAFLDIGKQFLESTGQFRVCTTSNSAEALQLAAQAKPCVALVDLIMPRVTGLELIPQLRQEVSGIMIIAVTLHGQAAYRDAAKDAGADAFVAKNLFSRTLVPIIQQLCLRRGCHSSVNA